MMEWKYKRGNIIQMTNTESLRLFLVESVGYAQCYSLINLHNKKRELIQLGYIDDNSILVAHEYTLQTKKRLGRLLKKSRGDK